MQNLFIINILSWLFLFFGLGWVTHVYPLTSAYNPRLPTCKYFFHKIRPANPLIHRIKNSPLHLV